MNRCTPRVAWVAVLALVLCEGGAAEGRAPALPIRPEAVAGATNAIRLSNADLEVVIFPDAGRVGQIGFGPSHNLLRLDTNLLVAAAGPSPDWKNFGGDWLWPVMQSRWPLLGGGSWPPPAILEPRPWHATAWVDVQGDLCCLLTNFYGPPIHLAASRLIRLDATAARVTIEQRITRTAPSSIPATLWHISQVAGAEDAALGGTNLVALGFTPPPAELLATCVSAVVLQVEGGTEHKVGSADPAAWVAARRESWLLVARASGGDAPGTWPDGGCRTEVYSNRGLGYTEIETLSDERALKPGESLANTLTLEAFHLPRPLGGCALADWIRAHGQRAVAP